MVAGTLPICYLNARILFDPGALHSFMSPIFSSIMEWQPSKLLILLYVATLLSDELEIDIVFPSYPVLVEGRELLADLVLLDVIDFDVIMGMDWLAKHYATVDYRENEVIFRISNDEEFQFRGNKSLMPQNLISSMTVGKMLRRGCQGYLAVVRDVEADKGAV